MIAEELKSNRTPLQCLQRYQQALNTKLANTSEWTIAEDILLKKAAEMYGTKNWQNAANMISGRSAVQCGARYRKSSKIRDDITEGSWLDIDERRLFLGAVAYELPTSSLFKIFAHGVFNEIYFFFPRGTSTGTFAPVLSSTSILSLEFA